MDGPWAKHMSGRTWCTHSTELRQTVMYWLVYVDGAQAMVVVASGVSSACGGVIDVVFGGWKKR